MFGTVLSLQCVNKLLCSFASNELKSIWDDIYLNLGVIAVEEKLLGFWFLEKWNILMSRNRRNNILAKPRLPVALSSYISHPLPKKLTFLCREAISRYFFVETPWFSTALMRSGEGSTGRICSSNFLSELVADHMHSPVLESELD